MHRSPPSQDGLNAALRDLRAGRLEQADDQLMQYLQRHPDHPEAFHLRGLIALKSRRPEQGIGFIAQAVAADPDNPTYYLNLGECYRKSRHLNEALACYRTALRLRPDYPQAHYNLGLALAARGELEAAEQSYRSAIRCKPDYFLAMTNLGNLLKRLGRPEEALEYHRHVVGKVPSHPDPIFNLGNTLSALGRTSEAEQMFRRVLALRPDHLGALNNLGITLREQGRIQEAAACHQQALRLRPDDPDVLCNLGAALQDLGRAGAALETLERAHRLAPSNIDVLCNLADTLGRSERSVEAEAAWARALEIDPSSRRVCEGVGAFFCKQGDAERARPHLQRQAQAEPSQLLPQLRAEGLCPTVFPDVETMDAFRSGLASTLDAFRERRWALDLDRIPGSGCEPSFNLPFHGRDDLPLKRKYAQLLQQVLPRELPLARRSGKPHLGIVVTRGHEGVFVNSVLANIRRFTAGRMRITVAGAPGSLPALKESTGHPDVSFMPLASPFSQLLRDLREAQFDLLYYHEVGSDTLNYFLPYFRLAPVQCTTWGIQVTTGIPNMDYYLSSRWTEAENGDAHYSEKLIRLDTLLKQRKPLESPPQRQRADFGLPEKGTLYFCPQHLGKLHPEFDPVIHEILARDAGGMLVLVEWPSAFVARQITERFRRTIPDVAGRVRILPHLGQDDYRGLLKLSDLLLDPFHFVGVNSTYDALSLHKPIVTLPGKFQRGRYTLGCYRKMDLDDCLAKSPREYVEIALRLARERDYRESVAERIAEALPVLFDHKAIAAELEECMVERIEESRQSAG